MSKDKNTAATIGGNTLMDSMKFYNPSAKDFENILSIQKKNIETIKQTQKIAFETFQEIRTYQNDMFSQIIARSNQLANDVFREGKPEEKLASNAALVQKGYDDAIKSAKEISAIIKKANEKATSILSKNATDAMKDLQEISKKVAAE